MSKKELRRDMAKLRNSLSDKEIETLSSRILDNLLKLDEFNSKSELLCFANIRSEVSTRAIMCSYFDVGKKVAAPKVIGDEMEFFYLDNIDDLYIDNQSKFKIPEPSEKHKCLPGINSVIMMPGLVFDKSGHRIGYGGGYYDKYLTLHDSVVKIAIAYDFKIIKKIDEEIIEDTDISPDYIVTDKQIIKL